MNTATHYVTRPGYEGACCLDCAAAVGQPYRELEPGEEGYGQPCQSCEEMQRDADADAVRAEEESAALDALAEEQALRGQGRWDVYSPGTGPEDVQRGPDGQVYGVYTLEQAPQ